MQSYGRQTVLSDLAALSLLGVAWVAQDETFAYASLGVYALGAPAVHIANGQPGKAGASLALRLGVPAATFVAAYGASKILCERGGGSDSLGEGLGQAVCILAVFGVVTPAAFLVPSAIDADRLAKKAVRPGPALSVMPTLMPTRQGAMVGLGGTF
ncbi:MAG TPA: hypothetical protein VFS43_06115 [Polyangiaceae bacterium]|nr:hypothetical protein [Polyangiaceae bacterium]